MDRLLVAMTGCATYVRSIPGDPDNNIWIFRRENYWLVETGQNGNRRMIITRITTINQLHDILSRTTPYHSSAQE
jgi:hypothetical protein